MRICVNYVGNKNTWFHGLLESGVSEQIDPFNPKNINFLSSSFVVYHFVSSILCSPFYYFRWINKLGIFFCLNGICFCEEFFIEKNKTQMKIVKI